MPIPSYKRCSRCRESKPLAEFNLHRGTKDGRQAYCRDCQRTFAQRNAETIVCGCGCGETTPSITRKGRPTRFKPGHGARRFDYTVEDRGHESPCWIFSNGDSIGGDGYGRVRRNGRSHQAHRLMYEQEIGPIPEGMELDHLCFAKRCVNPDHLEPVTQAENSRRRRATKLTKEIVAEIRADAALELQRRRAAGFKRRSMGWQDGLAARYGITRDTIKQVVRGSIWADV